jgi:sodium/bile acid cotransporter 7
VRTKKGRTTRTIEAVVVFRDVTHHHHHHHHHPLQTERRRQRQRPSSSLFLTKKDDQNEFSGSGRMKRDNFDDENARRVAAIEALVSKFADETVPAMRVKEVLEILERDTEKRVVFLDCRDAEERAVSVIPGAVSEYDDGKEIKTEDEDGKETIVICYCTIGYRSQKKVQELKKRNPDVKAYNLSGSIVAWTHDPRAPALVDPKTGKETKRVHTYGKTWALQRKDYEAVVHKAPLFSIVKGLFKKK